MEQDNPNLRTVRALEKLREATGQYLAALEHAQRVVTEKDMVDQMSTT